MGIYYNTILCTGFRVVDQTDTDDLDKDWFIKDTKGIMIFVPHSLHNVGSMDPVIDENEVKQGYVKMEDVVNVLRINKNTFDLTDDESEQLQTLTKRYDVPENDIDKWIVEYCWDTYSETYDLNFIKKLPIR
ncbi:hypothetical protein QKU48_gp1241 [Fadolivirus algeromassiliense]|jgi:hypothetical protein|uniref:Uncharacterized protein n=1 Tax=Fadolivirus FV1/VV64 TaxID=3070911 RepID=A0A7D3QWM3_9VIRU|nr:hypothetical protein QKU48_gp1241 [Fadolivirus algeromassiliense]QKF94699.1 hypothetical protein Fadolivirus_1_1241 [Fadolivirus FV1/VV64]